MVGGGTSLSYSVGGSQSPVTSGLGAVYIDGTAPVISGAFDSVSVAADAGTTAGAVVTQPTVTALDACENASRPVTFSIDYPSGPAGNSWPARFPVGVSTIAGTVSTVAPSMSWTGFKEVRTGSIHHFWHPP